jgi:archaellum biogenesis ATPase FlaH
MAERFSPFGAADCETEVKVLGEDYRKYFFYHTRFNDSALDPNVFLIIGRRGSGKTALSQYFSFQKQMRHSSAIDVDEPAAFQQVLQKLTEATAQTREVAIPGIAKVWEFVIWSIIFRTYQHRDVRIRAACIFGDRNGKLSNFIRHTLNVLLNRFLETEVDLLDELEDIFADERIQSGKTAILELSRKEPIIVAVDTLENYAVHDDTMMRVTAALIQGANDFNREYARKGIHLKVFMMAEVFPYIKEEVILNTLKFIHDEIYLHWRPKDLMRLISWRFYHYLKACNLLKPESHHINWDDHNDVLKKMWEPYFGESLCNNRGMLERTYPYVLRHSQMRPRQLIVLCNAIAERAKREKTFPNFQSEQIVAAVTEFENALADEVFNSYSSVYPKVGRIVEALSGLPMVFKGNELDKRAPLTASEWIPGEYSPLAFRQLVAELGIVGRLRHLDERAGIAEADFEYSSESRLPLLVTDLCVIHPMFYRKLNIQVDRNLRVYPFPDHEEYRELEYASAC